ncbi:hypothetical protein CCACVL1_00265, partial [Corchorus capsularis]
EDEEIDKCQIWPNGFAIVLQSPDDEDLKRKTTI